MFFIYIFYGSFDRNRYRFTDTDALYRYRVHRNNREQLSDESIIVYKIIIEHTLQQWSCRKPDMRTSLFLN